MSGNGCWQRLPDRWHGGSVDRVLVVDKPRGITSHDVVSRLRRSTGERRIGHGGTLDPAATGVLVVLVGKATRLMQFIVETDKEYVGRISLGVVTDTHDSEGSVISTAPVDGITRSAIEEAMGAFVGDVDQIPPMTSAIKRGGRPLYELARKGVVVEREPRRITIRRFELLDYDAPEAEFVLECSKGTYVRKLAHDVGQTLSVGAHLAALTRTRVGRFRLEDAATLPEIERLGAGIEGAGLSMFDALHGWPSLLLDDDETEKVVFGGAVEIGRDRLQGDAGTHVRLTGDGESLMAIGVVRDVRDDSLVVRPVKVFEAI